VHMGRRSNVTFLQQKRHRSIESEKSKRAPFEATARSFAYQRVL
jgi:hypothetical protein